MNTQVARNDRASVRCAVWAAILSLCTTGLRTACAGEATPDAFAWPAAGREARPWAYWWWMGSAVDRTNLTQELTRCRDAGMGGVHIIPIYGAKGWESNDITYLSPKWMELLNFTVAEAQRLDLGQLRELELQTVRRLGLAVDRFRLARPGHVDAGRTSRALKPSMNLSVLPGSRSPCAMRKSWRLSP